MTMEPEESHLAPSSGKVAGSILLHDTLACVRVPAPLLVFDTVSWAMALRVHYQDMASEALSEHDADSAFDFHDTARTIHNWTRSQVGVVLDVPPLALRQTLKPFVVHDDMIETYARHLIKTGQPVQADDAPDFLLDLTSQPMSLQGTPAIRMALQHTGRAVVGIKQTPEELDSKIRALRAHGHVCAWHAPVPV